MNQPTAAPRSSDFPAFLPPMLVKELRQGMRANGFALVFILFQVAMVVLLAFALEVRPDRNPSGSYRTVNAVYWGALGAFLLLVTPVRALAAISTELEAKTIDLLLLTRLNAWRIVFGKWASLMGQALLVVIALLPYGVLRYFFGSVNLLDDFVTLTSMVLASAVLTGLMLWVSAQPRAMRILMPIALVVGFNVFLGGMIGMRGRFGVMTLLPSGSSYLVAFVIFYNAALLLTLFLHQTVQYIAPPAENHAPHSRSLAVAAFFSPVVVAFFTLGGRAEEAFVMAFVIAAFVMATELGSNRPLMAVHCRTLDRGLMRRLLGRLLLPGWPSAALFCAALLALLALAGVFEAGRVLPGSFGRACRIMMLGWVALVTPAVILSYFRKPDGRRLGGGMYLVAHVAFGVVSLALGTELFDTVGSSLATQLRFFGHCLPVTSFWFSLAFTDSPGVFLYGMQALQTGVVAMLAWRRSRSYWKSVSLWTKSRPGESASVTKIV